MTNRILARYFPQLPSGWGEMEIGDALEEIERPITMRDSAVYDLISIRRRNGGMFRRGALRGSRILTKTLREVMPGTFVIARMQIVHGASALATKEFAGCAISKSYSSFRGTARCDANYFSWLAKLPFMYAYFLDSSHGVVIEKMTFDQERWLSFPVYLPPVDEQREIAEILDTVDNSIRATSQLIRKLQRMKGGFLHDLLTRGLGADGKLRSQTRTPANFKDTVIGPVPANWDVCPFGELASSATLGTTIRGHDPHGDNLNLLKMGNLGWGSVDVADIEPVARAKIREWRDLLVRPGDLLFNTRNTPELVGKTACWPEALVTDTIADNNILRVRFDDRTSGRFVAAYMAHGEGRRRLTQLATGTTSVAAIYWDALRRYCVPVPPRGEQEAIVERLQAMDSRLAQETLRLEKQRLLRAGLMNDLLLGTVRVTAGGEQTGL
jgi:type I restriction enzyme S subunit